MDQKTLGALLDEFARAVREDDRAQRYGRHGDGRDVEAAHKLITARNRVTAFVRQTGRS